MPLLLCGVDLVAVKAQLASGSYNTSYISVSNKNATGGSAFATHSDRLPNCKCGALNWEPTTNVRLDCCLECLQKNLPTLLSKSEIDYREKLMWHRIKFPEKELLPTKIVIKTPFRRTPFPSLK
jgi:hypothetical protein